MELYRIEILSSDIHPGVCNSLQYPGHAYSLVPAGAEGNRYGYLDKTLIENGMAVTDISREQLDALLDAAKAVKEKRTYRYKGDIAFWFKITYKTRDGGYGSVTCWCYDEFPEEWADFVRLVNGICGGDYLRENPEIVIYSDEWFSENFGIYEKDLPEGASLAQFMEYKVWVKNDMERFCGNFNGDLRGFDAEEELNDYLEYLVKVKETNSGN